MTVSELIKILQTKNPEAPVWLWCGANGCTEDIQHAIGDGMPDGDDARTPPVLLLGATKTWLPDEEK